MTNNSSPLLGFLCTLALFIICLLFVAGAKLIWFSIKQKFLPAKKQEAKSPPKAVKRPPQKPKPSPKPVRSIEIDPEQVDKIYVRKSS